MIGLDVEAGLAFCNGKEDFYLRMLKLFADGKHDFVNEFRTAFENGDSETTERLAHSLMGMSGTIGAIDVQVKSAALELALMNKEETSQINTCLSEVGLALTPLINGIVDLN